MRTCIVEQCRCAVDEVVDVTGRATIQAILALSAQQVTGGELRQQGKRRPSEVVRWRRQLGRVTLSDRRVKVHKPRLRTKEGIETAVPAYEAMQDDERLGARMLEIVLKGASTRSYEGVLREMAETVGVSKSSVGRESVEAAEQAIEELSKRRFEEVELLVIYIDGMTFGDHSVIAAVGVNEQGRKHVLGVVHGATENAAAVEEPLTGLVERGVDPNKKRLFVIDGSKALRAGICKGLTARCNGAARISYATSSSVCPRISASKSRRRCTRPGAWTPKKASANSRSWPSGWSGTGRKRRRACEKALRNALPSIVWACRLRCIVVWRRRTSSKARKMACAVGLVA